MDREINHPSRLTYPGEPMPATATAMDIEDLPKRFIDVMDEYVGQKATARLIGAGTAENIRRGRRKEVGVKLYSKIRGAFIRVLQEKRRRLDAEIQMALESGVGDGDRYLVAAAASLKQIEAVLAGAAR